MNNLKQLFKQSLESIFPVNAQYDYEENLNKIRINYEIQVEKRTTYKNSRSICIHFNIDVITAFRNANNSRLSKLEKSLQKFLKSSLSDYDENGPHDSAFDIDVDDRVLDLDF